MEGRACILRNNTPFQAGLHVRVYIFLSSATRIFSRRYSTACRFEYENDKFGVINSTDFFETMTHFSRIAAADLKEIKILNKLLLNYSLIEVFEGEEFNLSACS